ncbi:hypothetical protein Peur_022860 [Populus x canadensis]
MFVVSDALPFLRWLDLGGAEKAMKRISKNLDHAVEKWLEEHEQKKASGTAKGEEDFMDLMLSVLDDGKELSNRSADTINKATCLLKINLLKIYVGCHETLDDAPIDMTETGGITNIKATPLHALLTPRLSPGLYDLQ